MMVVVVEGVGRVRRLSLGGGDGTLGVHRVPPNFLYIFHFVIRYPVRIFEVQNNLV